MVSLCPTCHRNRHNSEVIQVYQIEGGQRFPTTSRNVYCSRCNGAGHFPEFQHVENGVCFRCNGDCIDSTIFSNRLTEIKKDLKGYNLNQMFDEAMAFIENVGIPLFKDKIKLPEGEFSFLKSEDRYPTIKVGKPAREENIEDDLPF